MQPPQTKCKSLAEAAALASAALRRSPGRAGAGGGYPLGLVPAQCRRPGRLARNWVRSAVQRCGQQTRTAKNTHALQTNSNAARSPRQCAESPRPAASINRPAHRITPQRRRRVPLRKRVALLRLRGRRALRRGGDGRAAVRVPRARRRAAQGARPASLRQAFGCPLWRSRVPACFLSTLQILAGQRCKHHVALCAQSPSHILIRTTSFRATTITRLSPRSCSPPSAPARG